MNEIILQRVFLQIPRHGDACWIRNLHLSRLAEVIQHLQVIRCLRQDVYKRQAQNYVYPMPLESAGKDDVYVGRIRKDLADDNGNTLWLLVNGQHSSDSFSIDQIPIQMD